MTTRTADFRSLSGAIFADSGQAAGELLSRSVITLSIYNDRRRPEYVATAILLRIDGRHLLATAGHAVVQTREQHLWTGFPGMKLQRIPALVRQASRIMSFRSTIWILACCPYAKRRTYGLSDLPVRGLRVHRRRA